MGTTIFFIIFNNFLGISHLLCLIDRSVSGLLLSMQRSHVRFPVKEYVLSIDMQQKNREDNSKLLRNEQRYSNYLVKIRVVIEVFWHAKSKYNLNFGLSLFLKEVSGILWWNPWQLFQVSETGHVFGQTRQPYLADSCHFCKQSEMQ